MMWSIERLGRRLSVASVMPLALLIGHEVTSKILAVVGTVLFGVVLVVLLLA